LNFPGVPLARSPGQGQDHRAQDAAIKWPRPVPPWPSSVAPPRDDAGPGKVCPAAQGSLRVDSWGPASSAKPFTFAEGTPIPGHQSVEERCRGPTRAKPASSVGPPKKTKQQPHQSRPKQFRRSNKPQPSTSVPRSASRFHVGAHLYEAGPLAPSSARLHPSAPRRLGGVFSFAKGESTRHVAASLSPRQWTRGPVSLWALARTPVGASPPSFTEPPWARGKSVVGRARPFPRPERLRRRQGFDRG